MVVVPGRFMDARFARAALVVAALAAFAVAALASPWVTISDAELARRIAEDGSGWRVRYGAMVCSVDDAVCSPAMIGLVQAIHAVQLAAIAVIALCAACARRRQPGLLRIIVDVVVVAGAFVGMVAGMGWAVNRLAANEAVLAIAGIAVVAMLVFWLNWRGRRPGPVGIVTFVIVKMFIVLATPLGTLVVGLRLSLPPSVTGSPIGGVLVALVGGALLALPIAMALLGFWPNRAEGKYWEHLAPRRGLSPGADRP
jgi:hypothetical protein